MKKVRKVLILFVIIIGMIFIRANIANAADSVVASGDCGESITWSLNNTGILTISGSGSMTNGKESPWSEYQDKVKSVVFDGTITTIGNYSFKDNQNIKEIEIPTTIQTIGSYAFYNCTNLKEINIPSSLYRINNYDFYGCASL